LKEALPGQVASRLNYLAQVVSDIEGFNEAETLALIKFYLEHPPKKKITFPIFLFPSVAALLAPYDIRNREAVDPRVRALCRELSRKNFKHTHQGIAVCFDEKGASLILDGGKRIQMVRRMNAGVRIDITFGLPTTVFHAIDGVQPRGISQTMIRDENRPNAQALVATVRAIAKICAGASVSPQTVDDSDEWQAIFAKDVDWSMGILKGLRWFRNAEFMAIMAVLHKIYPSETEVFVHQVTTGAGLEAKSPALKLRSHLMTKPIKRAGGNNPQLVVLTTANAFVAHLNKWPYTKNSTNAKSLMRFREELNELKKVRDLITFWKETGAVAAPDPESELELE
jgi:hypothetical protein